MIKLIDKKDLPHNFSYPQEFLRIIKQNLIDFDPWTILEGDQLTTRYRGLKQRYPKKVLVPLARREDNDDVACIDIAAPGKVIIIHDFSSIGYENRKIFADFWSWFRAVIEDMIDYEP